MSEILDMEPEPKAEKMSDMRENFKKGIFLISMLFLLVATFQLYFSIERIIEYGLSINISQFSGLSITSLF